MFGLFLGRPWAGVISCCGGWPESLPAETLPKDLAVFVTAGLYDFNYGPSRDIVSRLDALGMADHLAIFPDGHTWLPGDVAMDAVSWLELQAMKQGRQKKDDAWIASRFEARLRRAREIEKGEKPFEAYEAYIALAADFRGLIDVAPAETSVARLARQVDIEKFAAARQAAGKEENRRFARADGALNAFMNAGNARERHRCLGELGIPGLRREKGDDSAAGLSAERVLRFLFMEAANNAMQAYGQGDMKKAMALYELTVLIDPGRGYAWFNLACVYSRLGEKREAQRALEAAVRNGVRDREAIAADPDLEAIRGEPAYIKLLETLQQDLPAKRP
jgi:tetratricopeptide (TPR) repeat protein